jgi:hypothetical protein
MFTLIIDLFVTALAKGTNSSLYHIWVFDKNTCKLKERQNKTFGEFAQWCIDNEIQNMRHFGRGEFTVGHETFELCKSLYRAKQLREISGPSANKFLHGADAAREEAQAEENINILDNYFATEPLSVLMAFENGITVGYTVDLN